ncbi:unnamed protein product, partial [Phaeothamnion confervicola]
SGFSGSVRGVAVDKSGHIYALNVGRDFSGNGVINSPSLGRRALTDWSSGEIISTERSPFGNTRFFVGRDGVKHIFLADSSSRAVIDAQPDPFPLANGDGATFKVYCSGTQSRAMIGPHDLALGRKGRLYVTGQRWADNTVVGDGDLWTCSPTSGKARRLGLFGRIGGVELSPDDSTLYVSENFNVDDVPSSSKILKIPIHPSTGAALVGNATTFVDIGDL